MTNPCIDPNAFDVTDGAISPHTWLQWRHVQTGSATGTIVDPLTDTAEVLSHTLQIAWTNTSPISQHAYGLCTRGASQVITTANKRFAVEQRRGWAFGTAPADPPVTMQTSRHGGGLDLGLYQSSAIFGIWEHRQGTTTTPIGPDVVLAPGQTLKVRVAVYVVRDSWSPNPSASFVNEAENRIETGDTRLDIFAYPVIA
ncbi:hypothetical protein NDR87_26350 [Nocardia sp. CDC159]|uniref:DUF7172 domain-containing protein n=1 Tax=Nocardia pulmonis TaxID=2951408 RepID=A0A9X2IXT2_9NOCA|nr:MULTISPECIES: hypothetical protein [Nocardia]MCM6774969.1 hypothetical protein [Nocardia pulmonis]MCM6789900.1 hypothetical protein [Nocardia sp. CDC159]